MLKQLMMVQGFTDIARMTEVTFEGPVFRGAVGYST